ncbi:hypothetical protein RJ640_021375, partial [Escallonia rubra]
SENGDVGMRRGAGAIPFLLLAVDVPTDMGGSMRQQGQRPLQAHGHGLSLSKAISVRLSLLRVHPLLAAPSLLLAPIPLRPVPQFQPYLNKHQLLNEVTYYLDNVYGLVDQDSTKVYQLLGEPGTYYGVRFGKNIPWVSEFPFGVIKDPQYVGSILSLLACLAWVPFLYILLWVLGYVFMIQVESKEDPTTRAKPLS